MKLGNKQLVEKLTRSAIYRDYARAFSATTGLPVALREDRAMEPADAGRGQRKSVLRTDGALEPHSRCLSRSARKIIEQIGDDSRTVTCFAGLSDSAVPIRVGDQLIGFLQTGQVLLDQPTKFRFDRTAKRLVDWGVKVDLRKAREAYFHTEVLSKKQYRAILRLLGNIPSAFIDFQRPDLRSRSPRQNRLP